jgi:phage FluMu protein Com
MLVNESVAELLHKLAGRFIAQRGKLSGNGNDTHDTLLVFVAHLAIKLPKISILNNYTIKQTEQFVKTSFASFLKEREMFQG